MKPNTKFFLGLVLIAWCVLAIPIAVNQVTPEFWYDFPCFDEQIRLEDVSPDTRIVYCISLLPLKALSGAGIYDDGTTNRDKITARYLHLRRDEKTLYVNNQPLSPGESYQTTHWSFSLNPWLILTTHFYIENQGVVPIGSKTPIDVLYILGGATEGWLPNPLGLVIFGVGILLIWQGWKERKQASKAMLGEQSQLIQQDESSADDALNKFIQKINQEKLDKPAEEYLKRGMGFAERFEFDDAILEFVKVIRTSSPQEETYLSAKNQLKRMGFSEADIRNIE